MSGKVTDNLQMLDEVLCAAVEHAKGAEELRQLSLLLADYQFRISEQAKYDFVCKLRAELRARVRKIIRGDDSLSARELVGCPRQFLMKHIESMFKPCMDWECYGTDWHVDHIVPLSHFHLEDPEECRAACHWSNLQPMWAEDNQRKADRFTILTRWKRFLTRRRSRQLAIARDRAGRSRSSRNE